MVFSSMVFLWVFFPVVFIVHRLLGLLPEECNESQSKSNNTSPRLLAQNVWLLIASLAFYAWGEPRFVFVMLGSIVVNYLGGISVGRLKQQSVNCAKAALAITVLIDLGILCYFKYFSTTLSLLGRVTGLDLPSIANVVLPIGISFYTFQAISYVVDVYRETVEPQRNLIALALYISLFPQLVAGPIVKYKDIRDQLADRSTTIEKTVGGIERFIIGLAKKVLIANQLALTVDEIFSLPASELSTALAWAGALLYALQIYYDFSGYSDMAIGLGKMFGFEFMENFNLPYLSRSIREFWRRWHISLSTWFRDYLYIPLGGNRKGKSRTYINLLVAFFATGIWHGAGLSFIAWGLYHGFFMLIERAWLGKRLDSPRFAFISHVYALFVVVVGWVLFRADSLTLAGQYLHAMFVFTPSASYSLFEIIGFKSTAMFVVGALLCGPLQAAIARYRKTEPKDLLVNTSVDALNARVSGRIQIVRYSVLVIVLTLCIVSLVAGTYNPFIYFRF